MLCTFSVCFVCLFWAIMINSTIGYRNICACRHNPGRISTSTATLVRRFAPAAQHPSCTARYLTTNLLVVGKRNGGEDWISAGCTEYEKRLKPIMHISTTFLKTDDELIDAAAAAKGHIIALDEKGKQYTSPEFTDMFYSSIEKGGATVTFIIGGFAGLPPEIRNKYPLVSLSKLTWTHAMARLLLMEQIYRATEIRKGSKYHKE